MYARYLRETLGHELYEDPEGRGFLTYGFDCIPGVDFPHCYIIDIWTAPENRVKGVATKMADHVAGLAKSMGKKILFGSVNLKGKTPDRSMKVLQAYGMNLYASETGVVYLCKGL